MTERTQMHFSDDRAAAIAAIDAVAGGRGWVNVVPDVEGDVPDLKVNVLGLWANHGVAIASFVTSLPRDGATPPSSLGVLHSHGRLGRETIAALLSGAPFAVRQDHAQRGLVLDVPSDTPASVVLEVMCTLSAALCDYEKTVTWRLDLYIR